VDAGRARGSNQAYSVEAHNHQFAGNGVWMDNPGTYAVNGGGATVNMARLNSTTTYGGTETRPRNVAMIPLIKY